MNVMTNAVRSVVKLGLLAGAIVIAAVGVGQESQPAGAAHTQILLSYSNISPIHAPAVVVMPNGVPRELYAWVVNVDEASGASAYRLEISYDSAAFIYTAIEAPDAPLWLGNGGRSAACPSPTVLPGLAYIDCFTVGQVPPFGALGTGLIGKFTVTPRSVWQTIPLDLSGSYLINTPSDIDFTWSYIPVTVLPTTIVFMHCADFNGDGSVDLLNDILGVILQYGKTSADPDWDPTFDINKDGAIDLLNDILGTILQYNLPCTQSG